MCLKKLSEKKHAYSNATGVTFEIKTMCFDSISVRSYMGDEPTHWVPAMAYVVFEWVSAPKAPVTADINNGVINNWYLENLQSMAFASHFRDYQRFKVHEQPPPFQ